MKRAACLFCLCFLLLFFCLPVYRASAESSSSELVMEVESGRILYADNIDEQKPMASTTKILTAIIILEDCDLKEVISVPKEAVGIEGSSVYLKEGEEYTVEELLYGLMLRSGNDCSVALALHHSGSVEAFASEMNERARRMGAEHSHFVNPNGLPNDDHYTTARDLATITCYALKNESFQRIVSTAYFKERNWQNKNKMLHLLSGADGVKTGYTQKAGRCLVSSATRNGMHLVCVVLNCHEMYEVSSKLLLDAFACFHRQCVYQNPSFEVDSEVAGKSVAVQGEECFYYPIRNEELPWLSVRVILPEKIQLPVKKGDCLGKVEIYLANQLIFSENLCSMKEVEKSYGDILKEIASDYTLH